MKRSEAKQFVIYSRKSKFTGKGESVENQIEMCRQYIANMYGEKAAKKALVFEDEGFSGGNLERPQFKKMMLKSHEIKFDAIVVYRLDRISRNIGDFAKLIEDLGHREIDFISIREQFDTSSPMGRAMMYIASVFSQLERETIAERIRDNMHELAKTGRWLGGTTPTGYESEGETRVTIDGKTKKAFKLKVIPEEIGLVELIFNKFLETGSLTKTEESLLVGQYRTKLGNKFTRFAIRGILSNPVYMIADEDAWEYLTRNEVDLFSGKEAFDGKHGIMAYNRTDQPAGKAHRIKPMEEWIVSVGKHRGVITGKKWIQVQTLLELNKAKGYRKPRGNVALLSGLLYCGKCGDYMRPKVSGRKNAKGEIIYSYLCSTKEHTCGQCCNMKNASGNMLDAKLLDVLSDLSKNNADMFRQLEQGAKAIRGNREGFDAELASLKEEINQNESDIASLVGALAKVAGTPTEMYVTKQIDELHDRGEILRQRLQDMEAISTQQILTDYQFDVLRDLLSSFHSQIENMTVEQKRNALRLVVKKVVWDGENAHVYIMTDDDEEGEGFDLPDPPVSGGPEEPLGEDSE